MTAYEQPLFFVTIALYLVSAVAFTVEFLFRSPRGGSIAVSASTGGFVAHTAALVARCSVTGYAPMTNMYESLSFFAWCTVAVVLLVRWRMPLAFIGAFTAPLYIVLMLLAYAFLPDRIPTLVPALQSWLLPAHVMLSFAGEAWFVIGFAAAVMYLVKAGHEAGGGQSNALSARLPDAEQLDSFSYRAISLGYPLFTFGALVLGMVWAHRAWGRYWGWDPKEVWALVTFIVYSLYLHGRYRWGWRGATSAYLAIIGFAVTMFTLFGVNLLLSGLHSYATGG